MQDDNKRMVELLTDLLHEQREMRTEQREMREEQKRTTNAIWELTQIMQKIVIEPVAKQGQELSQLKERMDAVETRLGM
jgi:vacuolar-type H+-ATPase subunit I/STV1